MPDKLYVVVATFEYGATAVETKLLGICPYTCGAFNLIADFDYKKYVAEACPWPLRDEHVVKEFGIDESTKKMFYSETHYLESGKPGEIDPYCDASVTFNIFEA